MRHRFAGINRSSAAQRDDDIRSVRSRDPGKPTDFPGRGYPLETFLMTGNTFFSTTGRDIPATERQCGLPANYQGVGSDPGCVQPDFLDGTCPLNITTWCKQHATHVNAPFSTRRRNLFRVLPEWQFPVP